LYKENGKSKQKSNEKVANNERKQSKSRQSRKISQICKEKPQIAATQAVYKARCQPKSSSFFAKNFKLFHVNNAFTSQQTCCPKFKKQTPIPTVLKMF
jgi:hypothetical protein